MVSSSAIFGSIASGTKKRTFMLPGGNIATTGRPAGTSSPDPEIDLLHACRRPG